MSTQYAYIPEIKNGLVFSDPWYDESVWCQYRNDFAASNWIMKLDAKENNGYIDFELYIGRPTMVRTVHVKDDSVGSYSILHPSRYSVETKELGIDTAKIFIGRREEWDEFKEEAALYTGADGSFGSLEVFTCHGETAPAGYLLLASVDVSLIDQAELFTHLTSSFGGSKIDEKLYQKITDPTSLDYIVMDVNECLHYQAAMEKATEKDKLTSDRKEPGR